MFLIYERYLLKELQLMIYLIQCEGHKILIILAYNNYKYLLENSDLQKGSAI